MIENIEKLKLAAREFCRAKAVMDGHNPPDVFQANALKYSAAASRLIELGGLAAVLPLIEERDQAIEQHKFWKQRAKSAEGHLLSSDHHAASLALHARSSLASVAWDDLHDYQRAQFSNNAGAVLGVIDQRRSERRPQDVATSELDEVRQAAKVAAMKLRSVELCPPNEVEYLLDEAREALAPYLPEGWPEQAGVVTP